MNATFEIYKFTTVIGPLGIHSAKSTHIFLYIALKIIYRVSKNFV